MAGISDLSTLLRSLSVSRRDGAFTVVTLADEPSHAVRAEAAAVIEEAEGTTLVVPVETAQAQGWEIGFLGTWLTLDVHSSLEAVGLTAAVSAALAEEGIPCNVLAAFHHDHLLVPAERADDAVAALENLRETA